MTLKLRFMKRKLRNSNKWLNRYVAKYETYDLRKKLLQLLMAWDKKRGRRDLVTLYDKTYHIKYCYFEGVCTGTAAEILLPRILRTADPKITVDHISIKDGLFENSS